MAPIERGLDERNNGIPRFRMPMVLMQSVLVPYYSNVPDQVKPVLPALYRRVCSNSSPGVKPKDVNTCRLPFRDEDALSGYSSSVGRRRNTAKPLSSKMSATSKLEKERTEVAKRRLNQNLHSEHRVFMEDLKLKRGSAFRVKTAAAITIQRYMRGLSVRIKMKPEKYATLRASLETHYTKEELSTLVAEVIRRSGVTVA